MKFEIRSTGPNEHEIYIDGKKAKRVTAVSLKMLPMNIPEVTLTICPDEVNVTLDNAMIRKLGR